MGTTVQQRHPVAPRPGVLGVLRRLAVATGLAHRSPPPRRLASPCWLGLRRSTTWANGGQHVGGERSGTPGERVPPSLRSAWGLSAWRCGPPRAPGGGAWSPSKRWRSLRFRPPGAIRRRRPWRSRGPRPPPRRPAERRARPLGSAQTVGTLAPRSCCVAAGVGREGYPCAWAAGRATAVRVSPPPWRLRRGWRGGAQGAVGWERLGRPRVAGPSGAGWSTAAGGTGVARPCAVRPARAAGGPPQAGGLLFVEHPGRPRPAAPRRGPGPRGIRPVAVADRAGRGAPAALRWVGGQARQRAPPQPPASPAAPALGGIMRDALAAWPRPAACGGRGGDGPPRRLPPDSGGRSPGEGGDRPRQAGGGPWGGRPGPNGVPRGRCGSRAAPGLSGAASHRRSWLSWAQAARRAGPRVAGAARTDGRVSAADGAGRARLSREAAPGPAVPAPAGPAAPRQPRPARHPDGGGGSGRVCPRSPGPRMERGARGRAERWGSTLSPVGL